MTARGSRYKRAVTPEEKAARQAAQEGKLAELHGMFTERVESMTKGEDWQQWLRVASSFHDYSFRNVMLIALQRPDATRVAGYNAWQALGRQVTKGEKGIQVLAPVVRRPKKDQTAAGAGGEEATPADEPARERVTGWRVAYVWDVSQTTGDPLPEQPAPELLRGVAPGGLWEALSGMVAEQGFTVERGDCGRANGWTNFGTRVVRVRSDVDDAQAVKTLAHELGHVLMHEPTEFGFYRGDARTTEHCRGVKEVEAESVAYLTAEAAGLDTSSYTFPYVTGWAASVDGKSPADVVAATGQRVISTASRVLSSLTPEVTVPAELAAAVAIGTERAAQIREAAQAAAALAAEPVAEVLDRHAPLLSVHREAAAWFTEQLHAAGAEAGPAAYLAARGIPAALAAEHGVGYAPPGWTGLSEHLRGRGYSDEQLLEGGVAFRTSKGTVVDLFRERLMFPLCDEAGQVVGFTGRAAPAADPDAPKYLNTPATAIFSKSRCLFGLAEARPALAGKAVPVLTEGPLDALAVTAAGGGDFRGVSLVGTALTTEHVAALDRAARLATRGVVVALDSDTAGRAASLAAWPLLRATGAVPDELVLPDGTDPAAMLAANPAALTAALRGASEHPLADRVVDTTITKVLPEASPTPALERRVAALRAVAPTVAALPAEHIPRQVARLAERLDLMHSTVTDEVAATVTGDTDALGRLISRDQRPDLDRGQGPPLAQNPAQLALGGQRPITSGAHPWLSAEEELLAQPVRQPSAAITP